MNNSVSQPTLEKVDRSQKYFNTLSLFFYDAILYGVISKYAWKCSIDRLDQHYRTYLTSNHLEVGVGTGFLLDRVVFTSAQPRLALMDLSEQCLETTRRKVARYRPDIYRQNLLVPIEHAVAAFDSIAINYVMHCVPGSFKEKGVAFTHLGSLLSADGVLFGTTVLSQGVPKNLLARPFMWLMNALGVFNNQHDNADDLKSCLVKNFEMVHFEVIGVTAIFAVKKRRD